MGKGRREGLQGSPVDLNFIMDAIFGHVLPIDLSETGLKIISHGNIRFAASKTEPKSISCPSGWKYATCMFDGFFNTNSGNYSYSTINRCFIVSPNLSDGLTPIPLYIPDNVSDTATVYLQIKCDASQIQLYPSKYDLDGVLTYLIYA